jgi:hypothetical protein
MSKRNYLGARGALLFIQVLRTLCVFRSHDRAENPHNSILGLIILHYHTVLSILLRNTVIE